MIVTALEGWSGRLVPRHVTSLMWHKHTCSLNKKLPRSLDLGNFFNAECYAPTGPDPVRSSSS